MTYRSPHQPIVYADESGRPSVMQYRIAFTEQEPWLAIVELSRNAPEFASPVGSAIARDQANNRILDNDLRGLPLGAVRLVASDESGAFEYELSPDIHDYVQRGNRYKAWQERGRRGRLVERIEIDRDSLIAGRVRVDTAHSEPTALSADIRAALD